MSALVSQRQSPVQIKKSISLASNQPENIKAEGTTVLFVDNVENR